MPCATPPCDLAVDKHRVDQHAGILDHQKTLDLDAAGFDIDLDQGDVAGIGKGPGGS